MGIPDGEADDCLHRRRTVTDSLPECSDTAGSIQLDWHGDWNYTLHPQEHRRDGILPIPPQIPPQNEAGPGRDWLTRPALTGIPHEQWDSLVTELAAARAAPSRTGSAPRRRRSATAAPSSSNPPDGNAQERSSTSTEAPSVSARRRRHCP
ncbi:hypothetical protein GCM10017557_22900 [Streptomyces aurantiacus]|uniref:Uncharacterized protein n=1 Tax=Streptomyces aurantiacus TaxID=47760 RepID=A0A7G1NYJ4_9ACTN|nr:hypothetical protein GCM10017557_22900 [Streptomyces aurantiacus]